MSSFLLEMRWIWDNWIWVNCRAIQQSEREDRAKTERIALQRIAGALDPLLAMLSNFSSPSHLSSQILLLFNLMDVDNSGQLDFSELQQGLERLPLHPKLTLSIEDWEHCFFCREVQGVMQDSENLEGATITFFEFHNAIRWQLLLYGQRLLAQKMSQVKASFLIVNIVICHSSYCFANNMCKFAPILYFFKNS